MNTNTQPEVILSETLLVDTDEAARLLQISRRTLLRMNSAGKIPAPVKIGRCCRWRRQELESWLAHGCPGRAKWLSICANPKGCSLN